MHSLLLHFYSPLKFFSRDQDLPDKFSSIPWMVKGLSLGKLGLVHPASQWCPRKAPTAIWEIQQWWLYYQPKQGTVTGGHPWISNGNGGLGHVLLLVFRFVRRWTWQNLGPKESSKLLVSKYTNSRGQFRVQGKNPKALPRKISAYLNLGSCQQHWFTIKPDQIGFPR